MVVDLGFVITRKYNVYLLSLKRKKLNLKRCQNQWKKNRKLGLMLHENLRKMKFVDIKNDVV